MAAESLNDEVPKIEKLNKIQRKKVLSLIEQSAGNNESAYIAVKDYCMALSKVKVLGVRLNEERTPAELEVITPNTTHFFKLRTKEVADK